MNKSITKLARFALTCSAIIFSFSAVACDYPDKVTVPDGSAATKEELIAAQQAVKKYISEMDTYLECIVEEEKLALQAIDNLEPEVEQQREEMLTKKYNAGVDEEKTVEAEWNATVQAYKKRDQ